MNVNHIKKKIDIKKIHYKNTLDSLQTNCVVMNLLFAIYVKRYKAISLLSHAKGKTTLGVNVLRASGKLYINSYVLPKH